MALTTISGEVQAQPLNDNFSYLLAPDSARINSTSNDYGGAVSQFHIKNDSGNVTLTLQHSESIADTNPLDTMRIYRVVDSQGGTARQHGGIIIRETIQSNCNHHEFGLFSIIDNYATSTSVEQVGIYSQISSRESAASTLWGGVFEVKNVQVGAGDTLTDATTVDHVMAGLEIDVVNKFAFSDTNKRIGVECVAFGGGECTEAFSVYAAANTRGDGIHYTTGHWRYGLRLNTNSIDETDGVGIYIQSSHGSGLTITGTSANYGINLQAGAASTTGINIGSNYTNPIVIQAGKKIKLNGEGNAQGIYWDSANSTVTFDSAAIAVANHALEASASAGGGAATPGTVTGFLKIFVNGFEKRIPYYNT